MTFDYEQRGRLVTMFIGTNLDYRNANDFKQVAGDLVLSGGRDFVLDFSCTGLLDSTGLGALFTLQRKLAAFGDGEIVIAEPSKIVRKVCELTRVYKVFRTYQSTQEAEDELDEHQG